MSQLPLQWDLGDKKLDLEKRTLALKFDDYWVTLEIGNEEIVNERFIRISESLIIEALPGNRRPSGDIKIRFHVTDPYTGQRVSWYPTMKELLHWMRMKAKVEDNNYPITENKQGRAYLRRFLSSAFENMNLTWDAARKTYNLKE